MIPYLPRDLPSTPIFPKRAGKFTIRCDNNSVMRIWAAAILGDEVYCFTRWDGGGVAIGKFSNEEGIGGRRLFDPYKFHIIQTHNHDNSRTTWRHFVHSTKRKPKKNRFRPHNASRMSEKGPAYSLAVTEWIHGTIGGLLNYLDRLGMEIPCHR